MLSHKRSRIAGARMGLSALTAILITCQAQTTIADDRPAETSLKMVYVQVTIAVSGDGTDTKILDELQLTTLDGSKAQLQFGQQVAVPTGTMSLPGNRGSSRSYSQQQVGTLVQIQPRVGGDQILVDLKIEKSWIEAAISDSETDVASMYTTFTTSVDSTLALNDNKAQILKARVSAAPGGQREAIISVSASTKSQPKSRAVADKPRPPSQERRSIGRPSRDQPSRVSPPRVVGREGMRREPGRDDLLIVDRQTPATLQGPGIRRLFELIDKDKNGVISLTEWKEQRLSQSMESRGVEFSDKMDLKQFEAAVGPMLKGLRKKPDSKPAPTKDSDKD